MGRMPLATFIWPGLPQLWKRGTWSAVAWAVAFACLLNATLLVSFLWTELLPPAIRNLAWLGTGVAWLGSLVWASFWLRREEALKRPGTGSSDAFREALDHYLKANWFEAECILAELLRRNPRDLEAELLLVSLLRHTGRFDEAETGLQRLERLDDSTAWELEIAGERRQLALARDSPNHQPVGTLDGD